MADRMSIFHGKKRHYIGLSGARSEAEGDIAVRATKFDT
jgi:hypothetical protein